MLRILHIVEGTSVDGPGLRTSIYLAGCNHRCPGCHNPASWDFKGGEERTLDELMQVIAYNEAPVTLSGGDPLQQQYAPRQRGGGRIVRLALAGFPKHLAADKAQEHQRRPQKHPTAPSYRNFHTFAASLP